MTDYLLALLHMGKWVFMLNFVNLIVLCSLRIFHDCFHFREIRPVFVWIVDYCHASFDTVNVGH